MQTTWNLVWHIFRPEQRRTPKQEQQEHKQEQYTANNKTNLNANTNYTNNLRCFNVLALEP
eukprot:1960889-Alexandrium_andersonii.AAC.1